MTINTTAVPLLLLRGKELSERVAQAAIATRDLIIKARGCSLDEVLAASTKTGRELLFARYVTTHIATARHDALTESYVLKVFDVYMLGAKRLTAAGVRDVLMDQEGQVRFRRTAASVLVSGLGMMLVQMHQLGVLVLPSCFRWPSLGPEEFGLYLPECPLRLVREASARSGVCHPSFALLPDRVAPRFNFVSRATKLILALNWKTPADVRMNDLVRFDLAGPTADVDHHVLAEVRSLVSLLERHYGAAVGVTEALWSVHVQSRVRPATTFGLSKEERVDPFTAPPRLGRPVRLQALEKVPGCNANVHDLSALWIPLQESFLKRQRRRREGELTNGVARALLLAISYLNLYLFYYLPAWFEDHPNTQLRYPRAPGELLKGIFVSAALDLPFATPLPLVSFLERCAEKREWGSGGHYSYLKSIQAFFEFIAQRSSELPGCAGFNQPLSTSDFPANPRPTGTNKRPIPRQVLALFVALLESVLEYVYVFSRMVLSGQISQERLEEFADPDCSVIDTVRHAELVGFVPTFHWKGNLYRFQFLPNCLGIYERFSLRDGRCIRMPTPHGLHQVLVATFTGLRNEHIQWLDERLFDSRLGKGWRGGVAELLVNTDKVKTEPWIAHVNSRVIEALRAQREWRELIACEGFDAECYYQGNPKTKWPKIRPLFSLSPDGTPHSDHRYQEVWCQMLMCLQGVLPQVGLDVDAIGELFELLPSSVPAGLDRQTRYARCEELYGASVARRVPLRCKGPITPHSARVGVVSHYARLLPASVIGTFITGQTEGVVYHYVVVDPSEVLAAQDAQATALHIRAFGHDCEEIDAFPTEGPKRFIRADSANSRLVQAMATGDVDDVIEAFGCIAVSTADDGQDGIDILRATQGKGVAFNKTEICPFGNVCPPEIVRNLKGTRRCGLCPYAVRCIDHLPAIAAHRRGMVERISTIEMRLSDASSSARRTRAETEWLTEERERIADEATGFRLAEEVLERQRDLIARGKDSRRWIVPMPEVIEAGLRRVPFPEEPVLYLLQRLSECVAYPTFESQEIRGRFELVRRQLLANTGRVREALSAPAAGDPALECIGLLKTIADAQGVGYDALPDVIRRFEYIMNTAIPFSRRLLLAECVAT